MGANDPSRRRFLAGAGAVAAGTAAASLLPPSLQRALAAPLRTSGGSLRDIEHVVFLMQENRSFDHYYGVLRGVRGYSDRSAIRLRTGEPVFRQPGTGQRWTSAYYEPFLARDGRSVPPSHSDPNTIGTLPHNWESQHLAMAGGWHDDWIRAKQMAEFAGDLPHGMNEPDLRWAEGLVIPGWATTMAHYDRKDIPFHYELADTFTICDAYHCSLIGGTNPNRLYHYSGKLGIEPNGTPSVTNYSSDGPAGQPGFTHPTYPELLSKAGKTWKVYQEWDNFGDNALEYFASFRAIARKLAADWDGTSYDGFGPFYDALAGWSSSAQAEAAAELGRRVKSRLTESERDLYERGLYRVPAGQLGAAFRSDVELGTLPQVSYIAASTAQCEHPSGGTPVHGAYLIYEVLDALASDPAVWAKTAVFLTYDENDGYFDHVPPPLPPAGTPDEFYTADTPGRYYRGAPFGLGFRVPMTVISPWTVGGNVCSELFDHTSTIQFVENWLGVPNPNVTDWRRTVCGDLTSAFGFDAAMAPPALTPQTQPDWSSPGFFGRWWPQPPWSDSERSIPVQEAGTRPARPLPYLPEASARLTGQPAGLEITLANTGARSSHFAVYCYAGESADPLHFDVTGSRVLSVPLPANRYEITVTGPNRFRRDFAGDTSGHAAHADVSSASSPASGDLVLTLQNPGPGPLTFTVAAAGYGSASMQVTISAGSEQAVPWPVGQASGWYDLLVTTAEDRTFTRVLAGHIENGEPSVTG